MMPVNQYFQFIPQNTTRIQSGNTQAVMREAEQRHREVLESIVQQLRQDSMQRVQTIEAAHERTRAEFHEYRSIVSNELSEQSSTGAFALGNESASHKAEVQALRSQLQSAKDLLEAFKTEAASEHHAKIAELKKNELNKYNLKLAEVRSSVASKYQSLVGSTINDAKLGIEDFRRSEAAEFQDAQTKYELELSRAESQNRSLQDRIEDLEIELDLVRRLPPASQPAFASNTAVPSTPVAAEASKMTHHAEPAPAASEPSVFERLKAKAAAELKSAFRSDSKAEHFDMASFNSARSDGGRSEANDAAAPKSSAERPENPKLPVLPVEGARTPTVEVPSPSIRSQVGKPPPQGGVSQEDLITILSQLATNTGAPSRPRAKEADSIKFPDMPTPESYRNWKNQVKDEVKSCSDQPDAAWLWMNEVYDVRTPRADLERALQEPGMFTTLDTKLAAALTRCAKGDLGTRILNYKEERAKVGVQVRGRFILLMFDDCFKTSEEAGNLYRLEDILQVHRVGDTLADIKRFINKWDATLAGMATMPAEMTLRDLFLRQIRHAPTLKYDIDLFDRAKEGEYNKSYDFLVKSVRDYIDRERLRQNRDRIAARQNPAAKAAPAGPGGGGKGDGKKNQRGRSTEKDTRKDKPCFKYARGECTLGNKCPYKHDKKDKRARTDSPGKKNRSASRGRGKSPPKKTKMTKEEMAKTPCTYHKQGYCRRGEKCFFLHEAPAAAAKAKSNAKPRADSPNPNKKNKDKKATPCIVQHACIATRNRLPKRKDDDREAKCHKVRFSDRIHIRKIPARGEMCQLIVTPKVHETTFSTNEECPRSDPKTLLEAKVAARQLQEMVKLFDGDWEPACKFHCTEEHSAFLKLTCKCCRRLLEPVKSDQFSASPPSSVLPSASVVSQPTAAPVNAAASRSSSVSWLIDSGSEQDLVSEAQIPRVKASNRHRRDEPISLLTANGATTADEVVDVDIHGLTKPCQPLVMEHTPAVLSVGIRCLEQGYSFVWPAGGKPILVRPDQKVVELEVDGHVPVLNDRCKIFKKKQYRKDRPLQELFAMANKGSDCHDRNSQEFAMAGAERPEGEPMDEGVPEGEDEAYVRSRSSAELEQEAMSASHQFTHFPKNPFCKTCQRARMMAPQARKRGGQGRIPTSEFGDHLVADHVVIKPNVEEGVNGEVVALVVKDIHTQFRGVYPSTSKSSDDCQQALLHFIDPKHPVQQIYTDNSRELIAAMKDLGIRHQTSMPYVNSSKSFVEREIRQMLEGARFNLLQSGLPLRYWPLAMQHHSAAVNACRQLNGAEAPWKLRFGEEFQGLHVPFGAKILFWNNPARADNTAGKLSPTANDGIFLGYHIQPGHQWKGEYLVAKLEALDYHAANGSITVQRTRQMILPSGGYVFPLRAQQEASGPQPIRDEDLVIGDAADREVQPELEDKATVESQPPVVVYGESNPNRQTVLPPDDPALQLIESTELPSERYTPTGELIPENMVWDGLRLVRKRKGSQRPPDIPSEFGNKWDHKIAPNSLLKRRRVRRSQKTCHRPPKLHHHQAPNRARRSQRPLPSRQAHRQHLMRLQRVTVEVGKLSHRTDQSSVFLQCLLPLPWMNLTDCPCETLSKTRSRNLSFVMLLSFLPP